MRKLSLIYALLISMSIAAIATCGCVTGKTAKKPNDVRFYFLGQLPRSAPHLCKGLPKPGELNLIARFPRKVSINVTSDAIILNDAGGKIYSYGMMSRFDLMASPKFTNTLFNEVAIRGRVFCRQWDFVAILKDDGSVFASIGPDQRMIPCGEVKFKQVDNNGKETILLKEDGTLWHIDNIAFDPGGIRGRSYPPIDVSVRPEMIKEIPRTQNLCQRGIKTIVCGYRCTFAILINGEVWVWGANESGQLGIPTEEIEIESPMQVHFDKPIEKIVSGIYNIYAIDSEGVLWGWGKNEDGDLGDGTKEIQPAPKQLIINQSVRVKDAYLSCAMLGGHSTIVIDNNNEIWVWGIQSVWSKLIPDADHISKSIPVKVPALRGAIGFAYGNGFGGVIFQSPVDAVNNNVVDLLYE